jgi:hypothetical protein
MSTLVAELKEAINKSEHDWSSAASEMFRGDVPGDYYQIMPELKALGFEFYEEDHYGGEGQGDQYWSVIKVIKGDAHAFIKFDGWYASFAGSEMSHSADEFTEVKKVPVQSYEWHSL